jgi:hypothetical protein
MLSDTGHDIGDLLPVDIITEGSVDGTPVPPVAFFLLIETLPRTPWGTGDLIPEA